MLPTGKPLAPTVQIHKKGLHYNGLIPEQRRPYALDNQSNSNRTSARAGNPSLSDTMAGQSQLYTQRNYSVNELRGMNGPYAIKRPVRKQLFKYGIWKPNVSNIVGKPVPVHTSDRRMAVPNTRMPSGIPTEKTNLVKIVAKAIPTDGKVTHTKHNLTVCSFNPRSVKNKTLSLSDYLYPVT